MGSRLLAPDEPPAVFECGRQSRSPFVIAVDHAGWRIPKRLGTLGLPASELQRHIAWDIGALDVTRRVALALDATIVAQSYSRLVIDCNRHPLMGTSIPTVSEWVEIPGNRDISQEEATARRIEIFQPYHDRLSAVLEERASAGRRTILIAQHSMTGVFKGVRRAMHASVMYNRDRRFAGLLLDILREESGLIVGENDPYSVSDDTDYTLRYHGEARALPHVQIEIRQDLIEDETGQAQWARRLASSLQRAQQALWRDSELGSQRPYTESRYDVFKA